MFALILTVPRDEMCGQQSCSVSGLDHEMLFPALMLLVAGTWLLGSHSGGRGGTSTSLLLNKECYYMLFKV